MPRRLSKRQKVKMQKIQSSSARATEMSISCGVSKRAEANSVNGATVGSAVGLSVGWLGSMVLYWWHCAESGHFWTFPSSAGEWEIKYYEIGRIVGYAEQQIFQYGQASMGICAVLRNDDGPSKNARHDVSHWHLQNHILNITASFWVSNLQRVHLQAEALRLFIWCTLWANTMLSNHIETAYVLDAGYEGVIYSIDRCSFSWQCRLLFTLQPSYIV